MNRTFKVIARFASPEDVSSRWVPRGIIGRIANKRVYTSKEDFDKYAPETIDRYKTMYATSVFELIDGKWEEE